MSQQMNRKKPSRLPAEHMVHTDRYRRMDEEDLRELFSAKAEKDGLDEWMIAFCRRKYDSDFSREMSRSVAEYLKQYE